MSTRARGPARCASLSSLGNTPKRYTIKTSSKQNLIQLGAITLLLVRSYYAPPHRHPRRQPHPRRLILADLGMPVLI